MSLFLLVATKTFITKVSMLQLRPTTVCGKAAQVDRKMFDLWANGKFDFIDRHYFASGIDRYVALIVNKNWQYYKIFTEQLVLCSEWGPMGKIGLLSKANLAAWKGSVSVPAILLMKNGSWICCLVFFTQALGTLLLQLTRPLIHLHYWVFIHFISHNMKNIYNTTS